ncbi:MlaD family protein [Helicobacter cetorum]|uniref:ABC transport system substrate binding protein n=1 Tax=Helicobacter cetorum (strain ATCC BAA-540 / CCUG 52418 / MIT 99-5656) TaxID=1163745 RepID=I0ESS2_HELCM|nr:MlaD family protein [Helicobacter cetorum]AFI05991.1 ABC transport system substrate binding protein [Helicobacter cetorum MIT 99-5656]
MERHVNYTLIGGLFFLCLICMVGFILWLGHVGLEDGKYQKYVVYTDKDLGGIAANSPINYKGIQVGNVVKVGFAKGRVGVVRLDLMIDSSVKIRKDSKVAVSSQGLMGLKYLALEQSKNEAFYSGNDKEERVLIFKEGLMGRLAGDANQVVQEVVKVIKNIDKMLDNENVEKVKHIIASVDNVMANLEARKSQFDLLIKNANDLVLNVGNVAFNVDKRLKEGQYDFKAMFTPLITQAELSLRNIDNFVQKGSILIDKFEADPYKTIFGERK